MGVTETLAASASGSHDRLWRPVLALALPALAQQYLNLLVRLSDQYLADNFQLPNPAQRAIYLSALTTAGYLYWFVSSYTILVSVGATALVARFVGARDWPLACRATAQAILLAFFFGLLGSIAGLLGLPLLDRGVATHGRRGPILRSVPHATGGAARRFRSPSRPASRAWPGPATRAPGSRCWGWSRC